LDLRRSDAQAQQIALQRKVGGAREEMFAAEVEIVRRESELSLFNERRESLDRDLATLLELR